MALKCYLAFPKAEEEQARKRLEDRVKELEKELDAERAARVRDTEAAQAQAQELFDRLQAAEEASRELWEDASIVLSQQQGTPEEIACVTPDPNRVDDARAVIMDQLPAETVAVEQRFEAAVALAVKLHQLREQEAALAKVEITASAARCHRHEQYLEMLERAKRLQPEGRSRNTKSRDLIVSKIATCLARGYSVKEGTLSEVQLLRRQLNEAAMKKIAE